MHGIESIAFLLGIALIVVPLAKRSGLPAVIGYLLAGILIGPHVSGFIENTTVVVEIAEYGVAMLLFLIGLELEPSRLWVLRRSVFGLGGLQVVVTTVLLGGILWLWGESPTVSLIAGAGLAMSSTAFALQLLAEKNQLSARHGRQAFAILLFQDLAVIPLLALMPLLATSGSAEHDTPNWGPVLLAFAGLILASRFLVRPAFRFIANSHTPELFTGTALFIIVGVTWLMDSIHLSMSLGAFLAGMLLADSEYRHELEAQIQPFKGLLLGLFFMSVGMTANLPLLIEKPHWIILGALGLMLSKGLILGFLGRWHGNDRQTSIRLSVTLPQGGEFAFIVFTSAVSLGLMSSTLGESLVLIVTLSMALTPIGFWLLEHVLEPHWNGREERKFDSLEDMPEHEVIIAGFGRVGQIIARVLRVHRIQFVALESSARQVDFVRRFGNPVFYGKLDNLALLEAAGAAKAKLLVLAIDDVEESLRTAQIVRHYFPKLPIYARARDRMHAYRLMDLGINVVHRETLGTSLEMARDVLINIGFNKVSADLSVNRFREYDDQLMLRQQAIYKNESALVESAKQAMRELEGLFESDSRAAKKTKEAPSEPPSVIPSEPPKD
jgi:glutathione-regulated potassium-efflux system protein KefB